MDRMEDSDGLGSSSLVLRTGLGREREAMALGRETSSKRMLVFCRTWERGL
ncbi:hypothetical protein PanWU01x14_284060 [Parasponia andersonii]|uniref:Uncharacterized protein n=1 Tax=Parasponia andersonii TaxID=3476 RepID=A0A2P5B094_PARAD|nr:hypothetical protein PanWU01x14_284060 [Parasponia andersonii]